MSAISNDKTFATLDTYKYTTQQRSLQIAFPSLDSQYNDIIIDRSSCKSVTTTLAYLRSREWHSSNSYEYYVQIVFITLGKNELTFL